MKISSIQHAICFVHAYKHIILGIKPMILKFNPYDSSTK